MEECLYKNYSIEIKIDQTALFSRDLKEIVKQDFKKKLNEFSIKKNIYIGEDFKGLFDLRENTMPSLTFCPIILFTFKARKKTKEESENDIKYRLSEILKLNYETLINCNYEVSRKK